MTGLALPPADLDKLRAALRAGAGRWIARFYRHELLVARTVRGMQEEAIREFNREIVNPLLRQVASRLATFDLRGPDVVLELFPQLRALQAEIEATVARGSDAVRRLTTERLYDLTRQESDWVRESATKVLKVEAAPVNDAAIREKVRERPFLGAKVEKWFQKMLQVPTGDNARAWIQTGLQQGLTTDQIVRGLRGTKATGYTDGILTGQGERAVATLVRTAATHASTVARQESFKAIGVDKYRFVATLDSKTSIQCAANDGKVFDLDGPEALPPLHPNAVLAGSTFAPYGRLEEFVHAHYRGPCVHVSAGGYRTTIGPNHPMLTSRGMVKAAQLRKGDKLLRDLRHDLTMRSSEADLEKVPLVEDALRSLLSSGAASRVATASHDLHGDRVFCQGEVGVVVPDRQLLQVLDPEGVQHLREVDLVLPDVASEAVARLRAGDFGLERVRLPATSGMRRPDSWVLADEHWRWVVVDGVSFSLFDGMAFDATTQSSIYCSDGFVVSNCRSTTVPYFGDPIGNRASIDGPVPADQTFRQWLEGRPIGEQDEVLGKTRAGAWRAGKLSFDQMLGRDLQPLTVAELRRLDRIPDDE